MEKEYVIWGKNNGERDESLLMANFDGKPITSLDVARNLVTLLENRYGCTDVRIQVIDFCSMPDFKSTINKL